MAVTFGAPRGGLEKSGIGLIPRVSAAADGYGIMQGPAKRPEWEPHGGRAVCSKILRPGSAVRRAHGRLRGARLSQRGALGVSD